MLFLFLWLAFCVIVGMFAQIRRNRHGLGWGVAAIVLSPLIAFLLLLVLKPRPADAQYSTATNVFAGLCAVVVGVLCIVGAPFLLLF
jgi:hypothetical protein